MLELFDISSIFNNIVAWIITSLLGLFIVNSFFLKKYSQKFFQKNIYTNPAFIFKENLSISDISEALLNYRKKIDNIGISNRFLFFKVRISTFVVFTDGERILLLDRSKGFTLNIKKLKSYQLDVYGSLFFHNPSLHYKLPKDFINLKVSNVEPISGFVLEKMQRVILGINFPYKEDVAILFGFLIYLTPEDLNKGIDELNYIYKLSDISIDDANLTEKAKIGIKHLKDKIS